MALFDTPILGVDFTSTPGPKKPITVARARLSATHLNLQDVDTLPDWAGFEALLAQGPWVGGFDFPFALPRDAVQDLKLPRTWPGYVSHCASLDRTAFRALLDAYRESRPVGARYPHRDADLAAGSSPSVKLHNPPVALMFHEGAPRLLASGAHLPGLHEGDPARVALEAYPGHAQQSLKIGPYKSDDKAKQTEARTLQRRRLLEAVERGAYLGIALTCPPALREAMLHDASGDTLDSALCALQAAWGLQRRERNYGLPAGVHPLEGWIVGVPPLPEHR